MPSAYSFLAEMRTMRESSVTIPESVRASPTLRISLSSWSEVGSYGRQPPTHSFALWHVEVDD
jgi:hypothetical protein